jgi:hypothetical protein
MDDEQKLLSLVNDLDKLSRDRRLASGFNIFEAAGLYRHEIRHSNFLAFLLDPQQPHGLGDAFLKRLIHKAIDNSSKPPISPLTLALADFSDSLVSREWRGIDLVIDSKNNKLVFVVENKIDSSEGENQLGRYVEIIRSKYPNHHGVFAYLTKEGDAASSDL